jgi:integrase
LRRLGFIDFVNGVTPDARLFPELRMSVDGYLTEEFSKLFGKHLRSMGIDTPRRRSYHCLRHNARQALSEAGVTVEVVNSLMGGSGKDMSSRYGGPPRASTLAKAIELIHYDITVVMPGRGG